MTDLKHSHSIFEKTQIWTDFRKEKAVQMVDFSKKEWFTHDAAWHRSDNSKISAEKSETQNHQAFLFPVFLN